MSSTVTSSPCSRTRRRTNVEPMKPAPPQTSSFIAPRPRHARHVVAQPLAPVREPRNRSPRSLRSTLYARPRRRPPELSGAARPDLASATPAGRRSRARTRTTSTAGAGDVHDAGRGALASVAIASASARCAVNVGQPTWSSTTVSSSRSAARRSIVAGKHGPPRAEQPRGADDRVAPGAAPRDRELARELRGAVDRQRARRVRFEVWRALGAVEHVVAGDVDRSTRPRPRGRGATLSGAGAVDRVRAARSLSAPSTLV